MAKRIFIVSSSPRKGGNSDALAEEFKRGAEAAGNEVEKVNVRDIDLKFCLAVCIVRITTGALSTTR